VPIYVVTANVFAHEQLRDARAYVDGVLPKPLSRAALRAVLGQLSAATPLLASEGVLREEVVHDLESTRHKSGKTLLQHLLPQVERDLAREYASAEQALKSEDGEALRRAAHALCGQAAIVGAARAHELAMELELGAEREPLARVELERLLKEFSQAWSAARALLVERASRPPP
jgi:HPt (histidine-containing phosphotransfer) domain-containing protein